MKIAKVLSASILAGGILLSGTACSVSNNDKPEVNSSDQASLTENEAVAATLNKYYTYISTQNSLLEIKKAGDPLKGRAATASDDDLNQLVATLPLGFQYFDTSTPDNIKNAYAQLLEESTANGGREIQVPASAVTVRGSNATVLKEVIRSTMDTKEAAARRTEVSMDGKKAKSSNTESLKLKKSDSGSWVIIPEDKTAAAKDATKK